ncbi:MAG: DUF1674 domain-containing protein [Rickettsiales bacterium]|nr:DUF1674 domain-containing protein [Rickettsiales bacterium]
MNERTLPEYVTPAASEPRDLAAQAEDVPAAEDNKAQAPARTRLDPTRYGDWELNGKCVDF